MTLGLPWLSTYSAARRKSSIGADGPRFKNTGLPLLPASISKGKFCIERAPIWRMSMYSPTNPTMSPLMTSEIVTRPGLVADVLHDLKPFFG